MRSQGFFTTSLGAAAALVASLCSLKEAPPAQAATPPLLTQSQLQIDTIALSLHGDPAVVAAKQKVLTAWGALPLAELPDGRATLKDAVDEVVYVALRAAAAD